ncbi:membrane protein [Colwellia marinimaniae]|uniref:Membrane protein n=2 Tax=Colwelliaceae TaxID=267889 RepID=A0ABQ0MVI1_9GAMM|nr:membrane protein [Colwellia marinimaniae]
MICYNPANFLALMFLALVYKKQSIAMLVEHFELIEAIGLNLFFLFIFGFIGLSMHDLMNKNDVPKMGKVVVYFVLFFGCFGFVVKGIIQFVWENQGMG